jgi:hypothetical protein
VESQEIQLLQKKLERLKTENDYLKEKINNEISIKDSAYVELEKIILDSISFFADYKKVLQFGFQELSKHKWNIMDYKHMNANLSIANTIKDYKRTIDDRGDVCSILYYNFDRSSENITSFFSDEIKQFIYSFFENNTIYEDSDIGTNVKAILLAYKEIAEKSEILDKLYKLSDKEHQYIMEIEMHEGWRFIEDNNIYSDEMIELWNNNAESDNSESLFFGEEIFYAYSFWARRHQEGNKEIVYELLKEFDENVSKEEKDIRDFLEGFYLKYTTSLIKKDYNYISLKNKCLTLELINKISKAELDYDPILNTQKINNNTLKHVEINKKGNNYQVCYIHDCSNDQICVELSVKKSQSTYKINHIEF